MITLDKLRKSLDDQLVFDGLSGDIETGLTGLLGANGVGKSTLLRLMAGIYRPDSGQVRYDGMPVYENKQVKHQLYLIPENPWFGVQDTVSELANLHRFFYPRFQPALFSADCKELAVSGDELFSKLSLGLQRQIQLSLALACQPQVLLLDQTLDELDPLSRKRAIERLRQQVRATELVVVLASHNLSDLTAHCDAVYILRSDALYPASEIDQMKLDLQAYQVIFDRFVDVAIFADFEVLSSQTVGSVWQLILRGSGPELTERIHRLNPPPWRVEMLPLPLTQAVWQELERRWQFEDRTP